MLNGVKYGGVVDYSHDHLNCDHETLLILHLALKIHILKKKTLLMHSLL